MSEPGLVAQAFGRIAYEFSLVQPLLPTYAHLLISALFPIYAGAHASLSRPSSAAKPDKKSKQVPHEDDESSDEEEEEEPQKMEGLSPTDALMMPLMAGTTLAGLYFLIKWLQDPALLNKILNWYFAIFGVFSVSKLISDALDIGHSIIFPRRYIFDGKLYHVHGKERKASPITATPKDGESRTSPLPGFLSRIPLSTRLQDILWSDREMPANKWTIRLYLHRLVAARMKVGPHGLAGFFIALAAVWYFNFIDKPWYLTNLMGFGFSYGALQLMSPTTFATGSLILGALFFYDIYFVFFTPMMVTVAKSLDVPIKLVFPRPPAPGADSATKSLAMLGLGDVVLPGIMIGLALRFDLYLFYLRRQKQVPAQDPTNGTASDSMVVKPKYFSLAGRWSDHFWTHSITGYPLFSSSSQEAPFTFPKTYFNASLVGYIIGMLATLGVMQIWGHAQPALLYLVPGVLGSLWLTALFRGEVKDMWEFSEAVDEESEGASSKTTSDEKKNQSRSSIFSAESRQRQADKMEKSLNRHVKSDHDAGQKPKTKDLVERKADREVFSFSIEAPWKLDAPHSVAKGKTKATADVTSGPADKSPRNADAELFDDENRRPGSSSSAVEMDRDGEPVSKRLKKR